VNRVDEPGRHGAEILIQALRDPSVAAEFGPETWDLLIRLARRSRLLGRLAVQWDEAGLLQQLPARVIDHLVAAGVYVNERQRAARWEINRILHALGGMEVPIVLLKGSAYILAGLPPSRGRLLADVDLLVSRKDLEQIEGSLKAHGWESVKLDEYDQRYYRTWMHELPPLRHPERGVEVDIHHTISPLTSRLNPKPDKLISDSHLLDGQPLRVLQPVDMVLHSAIHLFYDGEFINGLRDLVDLADLFSHFGKCAAFWDGLVERAEAQDLMRPLFYATRYAHRLLGVDIPASAMTPIGKGSPSGPVLPLMDFLVESVLIPDHPDYPRRRTAIAQWLLYVRSHWLRMPPGMLIRHLARKQVMRWKKRRTPKVASIEGN
jgi:hypothetical protein